MGGETEQSTEEMKVAGGSLYCMTEGAYKEAPVLMIRVVHAVNNLSGYERSGFVCFDCFANAEGTRAWIEGR